MILSGELASQDDIERFYTEAQAAANLKHPNIVAIHEVGEHEGRYYFSMDYVEGQSLTNVIQDGPLPVRKAADYVKTIAEAIHFAHQRSTLHRDLKPQNILVDTNDQPLITDFGLAKRVANDSGLTRTGVVLGTPSYMPPEQALGRLAEVGPHSDVYSLGAILYELLTGRPPFRAASSVATLRQVTDNPPTAPRRLNDDVPQDLETICLKCLEKSPQVRYHSAHELAEELGRFLNHEPIQAKPASAVRKVESWLYRHPWSIATTTSLVILPLICVVYFQFQQNLLLRYQQSHTEYIPEAGARMERLELFYDFGMMMVVFGILLYRTNSLRLTSWQQFFDGTNLVTDPQPVSTSVRLTCGVMALLGLVCGLFVTAKSIEMYVWEGPMPFKDVFCIFAFQIAPIYMFSIWGLIHIGRDYRQATYGRTSYQIDPEQLDQMREFLLDGDDTAAVRTYCKAVPNAGLGEANQVVKKLAIQVEAEAPERYAANQRKLWQINWSATGLCLLIEVIIVSAVWFLRLSLHLEFITGGFVLGCLFAGYGITGQRLKKPATPMVIFTIFLWPLSLATLFATIIFSHSNVSNALSDWTWILGGLLGFYLVNSVFSRSRHRIGE